MAWWRCSLCDREEPARDFPTARRDLHDHYMTVHYPPREEEP